MKKILITSIGCAPASIIARTLKKENKYNIIGIDIQNECVGNFITDTYLQCPRLDNDNYWEFIENIITENKINFVFVTNNLETLSWSRKKHYLFEKYNCKVLINDEELVLIADDKMETYKWCIKNDINIPDVVQYDNYPCIIKPLFGCGASNIIILKNNNDFIDETIKNNNKYIIQKFINGVEFTVDVISDESSNIINIIPKQRLLIKNGQSFKSIIKMDVDVINFVKNVSVKLKNKSVINVQIIKEFETNKIFLIEINPRWPTTIGLSIKAGVNMPVMLVENDFNTKIIENNLIMIRDYQEYFMLDNNILKNVPNVRDCIKNPNDKNIKCSNFDNYIFKLIRNNINNFLLEINNYINSDMEVLEIGEYWEPYIGAKKMFPDKKIFSLDLNTDLKPDFCDDITKKTQFCDERFNIIICLEVLEHTENPIKALEEIIRITKKNGLIMLSMPCNYRIHSPLPDSFRFTEYAFKTWSKLYNLDIIELKCIEDNNRLLFPYHYTCIYKKL
jgi:carbamoyl-phosphate synthase large subunit